MHSPTAGNATCNTASTVTIAGVTATITSWSDSQIKINVPNLSTVPIDLHHPPTDYSSESR